MEEIHRKFVGFSIFFRSSTTSQNLIATHHFPRYFTAVRTENSFTALLFFSKKTTNKHKLFVSERYAYFVKNSELEIYVIIIQSSLENITKLVTQGRILERIPFDLFTHQLK